MMNRVHARGAIGTGYLRTYRPPPGRNPAALPTDSLEDEVSKQADPPRILKSEVVKKWESPLDEQITPDQLMEILHDDLEIYETLANDGGYAELRKWAENVLNNVFEGLQYKLDGKFDESQFGPLYLRYEAIKTQLTETKVPL